MRNFWLDITKQYGKIQVLELSRGAKQRLRVIEWYEEHGRYAALTCRHFGIARDSFYHWFRRLQESGPGALEEGSRRLKQSGRLVEAPGVDPWYPRRPFLRPYGVRKPKQYLADSPGAIVQVDTAHVSLFPGFQFKHFTACDVFTRWQVLEAHGRATAHAAAGFLFLDGITQNVQELGIEKKVILCAVDVLDDGTKELFLLAEMVVKGAACDLSALSHVNVSAYPNSVKSSRAAVSSAFRVASDCSAFLVLVSIGPILIARLLPLQGELILLERLTCLQHACYVC